MSVRSGDASTILSAGFRFSSTDGLCIACAQWDSRVPVRGVVQIAHGMGEHIGRYADTIEALVSAGFTVYGNDHSGHGRTVPSATYFGEFGEGSYDRNSSNSGSGPIGGWRHCNRMYSLYPRSGTERVDKLSSP
jgi:hypothetical protein